jgi:hypothetical protein
MESLCTPAVVTAALFTSLLFLDLFRREYKLLPGHAIFGVLATLLMTVLCQKGATLTAWGLLALPFLFLTIGWMIWAIEQQDHTSRPTYPIGPKPAANPCLTCEENKALICAGSDKSQASCGCKGSSRCSA